VASAVDVLTHARPHRPPHSRAEATEIIRSRLGKQLDPAIEAVFPEALEGSEGSLRASVGEIGETAGARPQTRRRSPLLGRGDLLSQHDSETTRSARAEPRRLR
jgi:hypothetical protein